MLLNEKHVTSPYGSILFVIVYKKGVLLGYDKTTMLEKKRSTSIKQSEIEVHVQCMSRMVVCMVVHLYPTCGLTANQFKPDACQKCVALYQHLWINSYVTHAYR